MSHMLDVMHVIGFFFLVPKNGYIKKNKKQKEQINIQTNIKNIKKWST